MKRWSVGVGILLAASIGRTGTVAGQTVPPQAPLTDMVETPDIRVPWPDAADPLAAAAESPADASGEVRYIVALSGLDDTLADRFEAESALYKGRSAEANLAQINRRIADDRDLLDLLLRAQGFYGGQTSVAITPAQPPAVAVTITVTPGPIYTVAAVDVIGPLESRKLVADGIGIKAGDPLVAATVQAGQDGLKTYLAARGHPFATIEPPDIVVDHATRTATLTQRIDPGRAGVFGRLRLSAKSVIAQRELDRLARFRPGDPYDAAQLDDLRRALVATGLVGGVTLTPVAAGPTASGREAIDIAVRLETAPLRTIAATAGYSTSQGVRVEASWQHRNLLPPNGGVTFRAVAAEREQLAGVELRRLNWRARDLTLVVGANFDTATQDAFNAQTLTFSAAVARETNLIWQKKWYFSAGTEAVVSTERDKSAVGNPKLTYYIAAVPLSLTYDGSDNLLDAHRGFRLTGRASPELSFNGDVFGYVKFQAEGSTYLPLSNRVTLAARGHVGTIAGATQRNIAPSRRFYGGGGGSVRGYSFQAVGPQAADGTPTGGDSLVEASFEARFRFGDFGIVPFFDAGEVDTSLIPRFRNVRYGGGLGFRYYTGFGPVRIDVATPANPRPGDPRVQFYVSIGQAF